MRDEVGLTVSVGVARTKLVAKIASDLRKPDGLVVVPPGEEAAFLAPLPIARLWGVGEKTAVALADYVGADDRRPGRAPADLLVRRFGKHGASLVERARGIDADPVHDGDPAKSVGPRAHLRRRHVRPRGHRADAARDVRRRGRPAPLGRRRAGDVTVKIRDTSFRTITRQRTLAEPTDLTEPIFRAALELARPEVAGMRVRLLGRDRVEPGRARAARAVRGRDPRRRAAIEAADTRPAAIRRAGGDAGAAGRRAGCRRRSSAIRATRWIARARGVPRAIADERSGRGRRGRDSLGDTDGDDIPPRRRLTSNTCSV